MHAPLTAGQRFGAYAIEAVQGEGGMGAVYRARDTKLGRTVALKIIRPPDARGDGGTPGASPRGSGAPDADTIARFLREARVGAALSHPNIAVVYEAGAIGDQPYLAMEWVDGASLAALAARPGGVPRGQALDILDAVADALAYAHAQGVIHRDVKPSNVMVDPRGRARLVDFGIAKPTTITGLPGTQMLPTHARQVLGTPAYMAPEQMLSPSVDARADQFSWAVMAYEILGGAHPIETVPENGPAFPVGKPRPLGWLQPDVPEAIAAVVHRALSYDASARFPTMDELLAAWRTARGGAGLARISGAPMSPLPSATATYDVGSADTAGATRGALGTYGPSGSGPSGPPPFLATNAVPSTLPAHPPHPSYPSAHPSYPGGARTSMNAASYPPPRTSHAQPARSTGGGFPWVVVAAALGLVVLVAGGIGIFVVVTGKSPTALPVPAAGSSPLPALPIGGPKTAYIESLDELKSTAPPVELGRAKVAAEQRMSPCLDASVSKDLSIHLDMFVAADGRVTKLEEQNVCKEQHPGFYICTERANVLKPKRGYPTANESVFACIDRALLASRFPKPTIPSGDTTVRASLTIEIR